MQRIVCSNQVSSHAFTSTSTRRRRRCWRKAKKNQVNDCWPAIKAAASQSNSAFLRLLFAHKATQAASRSLYAFLCNLQGIDYKRSKIIVYIVGTCDASQEFRSLRFNLLLFRLEVRVFQRRSLLLAWESCLLLLFSQFCWHKSDATAIKEKCRMLLRVWRRFS